MKKVLVIGEAFSDIFVYCKSERLSPEACCPVLLPVRQTFNFGGAANVAENLKALCPDWKVFGLHQQFDIVKRRYVHEEYGSHICRVDENDYIADGLTTDQLTEFIEKHNLQNLDAIVISDYCKGFVSEKIIEYISKCFDCPIYMDTKKLLGPWANYITIIKINDKEFIENVSQDCGLELEDVQLLVTKGGEGIWWFNQDILFPTDKVEVRDVVGAGDTALAAIVADHLNSSSIESAISYANKAARVAVLNKGVKIVSKKDVGE